MTNPIKITREEVKKWILEQSDDRSINYNKANICDIQDGDCGCLMIEYARDNNIPVINVGVISFNGSLQPNGNNLLATAEDWLYDSWGTNHKTFKTLKERVLNES